MREETKVVHAITIVENNGPGSLLQVEFKEGKKAYMIQAYSEVSHFLDQEVLVTFRKDLIKGNYEEVINQLTLISRVAALDKASNIKLYVNDIPDTGSNIYFKDLVEGEFKSNCIVYCDRVNIGSSPKATWVEFKVLDKKRNVAFLKIFNPDRSDISIYQGKYLLCDVRKTVYGLTTQDVRLMENLTINANPELELARQFLMNSLMEDLTLLDEVKRLGLMDALTTFSYDEKVETGYLLVQTAMEVAFAGELRNLSKDIDFTLVRRAFIANKLYTLTHDDTQSLSKEIQSVMKLTTTKISSKKLIALIEEHPTKHMLEHAIMRKITEIVRTLLNNTKSEGLLLSSDKIWGGK